MKILSEDCVSGYISPKPKNKLAENLLPRLIELGYRPLMTAWKGNYCAKIKVCNPAEAAILGMELGTGWGDLTFDMYPDGQQFVVFRDAYVQA